MPRHRGCESAGIDSNPRVLGGGSVSTPRKTPRVCLKSTCAATLIWPKSAASQSDLSSSLAAASSESPLPLSSATV